ncbi:hypothetical protein E2C01_023382 [Portunus trituberculatus]|uniref:Uncharacterized protein n=1 Tax=Portunus trituberculatus TaxID=210409 RepID=A0A5B7EB00_PORTR|nr:hypothetical protein [Portunus trituberculatus]
MGRRGERVPGSWCPAQGPGWWRVRGAQEGVHLRRRAGDDAAAQQMTGTRGAARVIRDGPRQGSPCTAADVTCRGSASVTSQKLVVVRGPGSGRDVLPLWQTDAMYSTSL